MKNAYELSKEKPWILAFNDKQKTIKVRRGYEKQGEIWLKVVRKMFPLDFINYQIID